MAAEGTRSTLGRGQLYGSVLETVGNTPVIKINRLAPEGIDLFVKAEYFNPGASVKDRLALNIIEHAERTGKLKPGQTVVEATSGNTGVGLAMVCAAKGYPLVVTMVETFSVERRKLMRFLGAKVVLTPKAEKGLGMYRKAQELAEENGWFYARQFESEANADIHEMTTGQEILHDFRDRNLDWFVTGFGTGGTVTGVARALRRHRPGTKIALSEPDLAPMLASGTPQDRMADGGPEESHPAWQPHPIQGWSPDFIPLVLQEAIDEQYYDELLPVSGAEGMAAAKDLALKEGIMTGVSGGSTFAVALKVAEKAPKGSAILCMLPDTAERYLSTPLFESFDADMNDDEIAISRSTPMAQLP
ncbi:MAG: pyridoxal-phosphate dependent enzyme [Parvularcula sp.]|jgi:cysteine synthase A|nr:pyridoxal-phosphate dependent enzyme [Parvularcula sp.]